MKNAKHRTYRFWGVWGALSLLFLFSAGLYAADNKINEDDIFGDDNTVIQGEKIKKNPFLKEIENESLTLTGSLTSRNAYHMNREWMKGNDGAYENNRMSNYFQSYFSLDARLRENIKGFINASLNYYPAGTYVPSRISAPTLFPDEIDYAEKKYATYSLNEIFLDFNIKKHVYFRIGKQNLKWGVGYLWMPNDLINVDKKNILDPYQVRQGVYGLKIHVPFGTRVNLYSFVNFNDAENIDESAVSGKIEVLIKNTEMSISATKKKGNVPVFGYDITSRALTLDLHGEVSISRGDSRNYMRIDSEGNPTVFEYSTRWSPRICLGLGRGFDVFDIKDRIRVDAEFFYNRNGYSNNLFSYGEQIAETVLTYNIYEPNYHGKYYGGLFFTITRLFVQDLFCMVNYIINLSDYSSVLSTMFSYTWMYNLTFGLMINGYMGKKDREFTFSGNAMSTEITVRLVF
ncbi:hypothetical protein ACFL20_01275 [Spirochaetota bacterium]